MFFIQLLFLVIASLFIFAYFGLIVVSHYMKYLY